MQNCLHNEWTLALEIRAKMKHFLSLSHLQEINFFGKNIDSDESALPNSRTASLLKYCQSNIRMGGADSVS